MTVQVCPTAEETRLKSRVFFFPEKCRNKIPRTNVQGIFKPKDQARSYLAEFTMNFLPPFTCLSM